MICASCKSQLRSALQTSRLAAYATRTALTSNGASRPFSTTPQARSHIGGAPLSIPPDVTFKVLEPQTDKKQYRRTEALPTVEIAGPLGTLTMPIQSFIQIKHDDKERKALVSVKDRTHRFQRAMWGTTRAYLQNHITGVSEGHTTILRLNGVGYRATIEDKAVTKSADYPGQKFVSLKVGYSHPIELGVPLGVKASTPQPTRILLEGPNKEEINSFAAQIRKWRVPEPYKGKGIFVNNETIKLKNKKIK